MSKLYDLECYRATSVELKKYIDALKYTLPISKSNVLGGVMVGSNIQITDDGTISVKDASLTEKGVVQLSDNISSNSTTMAATSNAVKKVNDKVNEKSDKGHTHTKSEITDFAHTHDDRYYTESEIDTKISDVNDTISTHANNTSNPHKVTKSQVGLGNVDNTSDINKPVSTAQQSAIDSAYENSNAYTDQKIADLINGAPTTLDTLGELAAAMQEHEDVVSALNEAIGTKANQSELDTHIKNTTIHIVASERTNWNAAKTHADSAHAPSNAQANVIETVKVNGTALVPSSKAVNIIVPTNNNQLENGAGYITSEGTAKTISDVLPISKGGTGKTNGADALNTLINSLTNGTAVPTDADYYISQYVGGGTSTTTYHRRPMSSLWSYINSKLATVATSGSYNDLSNKPTIPTVGNGTITITQNGVTKGTFTLNQSGNATIALTDNNTTYGIANSTTPGMILSGADITVDANGNVNVNDDSHNHIIANIDGLQTALDGKSGTDHTHPYLPLTGGTLTGEVNFNKNVYLNNETYADSANIKSLLVTGDARFVNNIYGNLIGNADTASLATKATSDSAGQQINTTYIKGLSISGRVITYTKGDGSTGTITTQDTNTYVTQSATTTSNYRPLLMGYTNSTDSTTLAATVTNQAYASTGIYAQPSTGTIIASIFKGTLDGGAKTASKWDTVRTLTLTGAVTGSVSMDGSCDMSLATTVNHTHNYAGSSSAGGSATNADKPLGFNSRVTTATWGNQNGTVVTDWHTANGGDIVFRENNAQLNVVIDGFYYQNEGKYKCLDENNYTSYTVTKTGSGASGTWGISITGNAATSTKLGTTTIGNTTNPIYLSEGTATACSGRTVPGIKSATAVTTLGWGTNNNYVADISLLSYWNGAYSGTSSNLAYCSKGAFGTIITKNSGDYLPIGGGTLSGDLNFSNSSGAITWNSGSWFQRILTTDDSTADTPVFSFQQSSDSGTNWTDLMVIRDNGKVIANTFVGNLSGNADSATLWNGYTQDIATLNSSDTWLLVVNKTKIQHRLATDFALSNHTHSYLPLSGGTINGRLIINPGNNSNWCEGIRINKASDNWTSITMGGDSGSTSGAGENIWSLHTNPSGNFIIAYNGSGDNSGLFMSKSDTTIRYKGNTILHSGNYNSYSLPLSGGTLTGNLTFSAVTSTTYPAKSNKIVWSGSTDGAEIYYQVDASDAGRLVFNLTDDTNARICFALNGTVKSYIDANGNFSGNSATATTVNGHTVNSDVPANAKFTDTTYTAGAGLSLSGNTFAHTNSITAGTAQGDASKTLSFGGTFTIPTVTYDAQGHVTGKGTTTMTMPANPNTDTKNTAGSTDTSSKIFLIGATSQAANPQTYSDNQVYATNGQLDANKVRICEKVSLVYDSSTEALNFVFA